MSDIFLKVFNMSITASWLILAVLCFRLVFRRAPKWLNCLLWGVVALRLVCPFSLESDFSLQPSAQPVRMATAADGEAQPYIPVVDSHLEIVENNINPMLRETFSYKQSDSVAPLQEVTFAAGNVWLAGILFMAGFAAVSVKNEVMEMIAKVRERKGRLDLPIVSGKHLRKIADRTALQSADNVEKFITARKMRYDKEHKDSLSKYPELRKRMQR